MRRQKNFRMSEAVPQLVRKYRTFSPKEIREKILQDYNKDVTPESVTMFFKRHRDVQAELEKEVVQEDVKQVEISESLFEKATFNELESIRKWNLDQATRVSQKFQRLSVNAVKNVCRGVFVVKTRREDGSLKWEKRHIESWILKHPDRLTVEQAKEFLAHVHRAGNVTNNYRIALRSFFQSKGIIVQSKDISGEPESVGKYDNLYVEKPILEKIFDHIKQQDYEAYLLDTFMYKTATRVQASLDVRKRDFWKDGKTHMVRVVDKGLHRKGRQTWDKIVPLSLMEEIEKISQDRDRVFSIDSKRLGKINKTAYTVFLKENPRALDVALKEPNHFWRHMFAQHMLRATNWNYVLVAKLGGWSTIEALMESYGMPPTEMIRREGLLTIPEI